MSSWAALLLLAQATAAPSAPSYPVYGAGLRSCGEWTKDRREDGWPSVVKVAWLGGYLSGQSAVFTALKGETVDVLENADMAGAVAWIDNYCAANPLASLSVAAQNLVVALTDDR